MPTLFCARLLSSPGFFQHANYFLLISQYPLQILLVLLLQMPCEICVAFLRQVALVIECLQKDPKQIYKIQRGQFLVVHSTLPLPQHPPP